MLMVFIVAKNELNRSNPENWPAFDMVDRKFSEPDPRTHSMGPPMIVFVRVPKTGSKTLRGMFEHVGINNKVLWREGDYNVMTKSEQVSFLL